MLNLVNMTVINRRSMVSVRNLGIPINVSEDVQEMTLIVVY